MERVEISKMSVEKSFEFDASHRLLNYDGACKNLHGHRWKVAVSVSKPKHIKPPLTKEGFLFDFHDFKFFGEWLHETFDHATIVNVHDEDLLEFVTKTKQKHYAMEGNPTVENLSLEMLLKLRQSIFRNCHIVLSLWETPSSKLTLTSKVDEDV